MRVPVLITETFAAGMTALLGSVMRPVREAFDDCAFRVTGESRAAAANAIAARNRKPDIALLQENTIESVSLPSRAGLRGVLRESRCTRYSRAVKASVNACLGPTRRCTQERGNSKLPKRQRLLTRRGRCLTA